MNVRWPACPGSNYAPWYLIAWRAVWVVPLGIAMLTTAILTGIMELSVDEGRQQLRRMM